jgi:chaperonin GroEL (HSP60 family)
MKIGRALLLVALAATLVVTIATEVVLDRAKHGAHDGFSVTSASTQKNT